MKKTVRILFFAIFIASTACSNDNNPPDGPGFLENDTTDIEVPDDAPQADNPDTINTNTMILTIGSTALTATLVENSSTEALKEALAEAPVTIDMHDYGNMEKVGSLGRSFPENNKQITTEPGDLILYQGNAFVIYYAPNSWNFTRLGKIDNITPDELKSILGDGDVTVTLSLE